MESLKQGLDEEGENLAIYTDQDGYPKLRQFIADKLSRERDMKVGVDDIIMGDGSGQPIHMICEAFLNPGDIVFTEDFVYSGTLSQLRRFNADIRGVDWARDEAHW